MKKASIKIHGRWGRVTLPDYAVYVAMDTDGEIYAYESKPSDGHCFWHNKSNISGQMMLLGCVKSPEKFIDWRKTLKRIPGR